MESGVTAAVWAKHVATRSSCSRCSSSQTGWWEWSWANGWGGLWGVEKREAAKHGCPCWLSPSVLLVSAGIDYKTTTILLDGRRVKLELWWVHFVMRAALLTYKFAVLPHPHKDTQSKSLDFFCRIAPYFEIVYDVVLLLKQTHRGSCDSVLQSSKLKLQPLNLDQWSPSPRSP